MKINNCQSRGPYPSKSSFEIDGGIKTFSWQAETTVIHDHQTSIMENGRGGRKQSQSQEMGSNKFHERNRWGARKESILSKSISKSEKS